MRATLIDANGKSYEFEDFDLSISLAEQRPDLADVAMPALLAYTSEEHRTVVSHALLQRLREVGVPQSADVQRLLVEQFRPPEPIEGAFIATSSGLSSRRVFAPEPSPYRWPAADRPGARKQRRGR